MNRIQSTISSLESSGSITLVCLSTTSEISLQLLLIDTPTTVSYLKIGASVTAIFKETEVILATASASTICIPNQISASISHFEDDLFLTRVHLNSALGKITALVHKSSLQKMQLFPGDEVSAFIKMNEIMLAHD